MEVPAGFQQNTVYQHPMSTPWTLGSTDGTFALQLMQLQQQEQQQAAAENPQAWNSITANNGGSTDANTAAGGGGTHAALPGIAETPSAVPTAVSSGAAIAPTGEAAGSISTSTAALVHGKSLFQERLFRQPSASVEAVLAASCEVMGFDISEMWLRTGPKTHQLTNSHLRPTALEDSVRKDLVDVYYGDKSSERTHRLSPALCKRAKEAKDVVWVTAHTPHGAEALRCSISNVRTAVAIPVCHEASNTNITIIFCSIRRYVHNKMQRGLSVVCGCLFVCRLSLSHLCSLLFDTESLFDPPLSNS
jgi:hypothetical protein